MNLCLVRSKYLLKLLPMRGLEQVRPRGITLLVVKKAADRLHRWVVHENHSRVRCMLLQLLAQKLELLACAATSARPDVWLLRCFGIKPKDKPAVKYSRKTGRRVRATRAPLQVANKPSLIVVAR